MAVAFGRFELQEKIAEGALAEVFAAVPRGPGATDKALWVKQLRAPHASNAALRALVLEEAPLVSTLVHPNIGRTYELGVERGRPYAAVEPLTGATLELLLERGAALGRPLPIALGAYVLARAADGLSHAHEKRATSGEPLRIVHRDLSPRSLVLTREGQVKVVDFGLGRALDRAASSEDGIARANFHHRAPEQIQAPQSVDSRADVFVLGALLHQLITGRPLFADPTEVGTVERIVHARLPAPSGKGLPGALGAIAMKALERDREGRIQSARQFARQLDEALAEARLKPGPKALAAYVAELLGEGSGADGELPPVGRLDPDPVSEAADLVARRPKSAPLELVLGRLRSLPELKLSREKLRRWIQPWHWAALGSAVVLAALAIWGVNRRSVHQLHQMDATLEALNDRSRFREPEAEGHPERQRGVTSAPEDPPPAAPAPPAPAEAAPADEPVQRAPRVRRTPAAQAVVIDKPRRGLLGAEPTGWGRLTLDISPWADIYFRGAKIGTTPIIDAQLPAGRIQLRAVNREEGIDRTFEVQIGAGRTTTQKLRWH